MIASLIRVLLLCVVSVLALELSTEESYKVAISSKGSTDYKDIADLSFAGKTWQIEPHQEVQFENGKYCVSLLSAENLEILPCFNYKELSYPISGILNLELSSLSMIDSISLLNADSPTLSLTVKKSTRLMPPALKTPERVNLGVDGKPSPLSAAAGEQQSFLQRNWMYIVPPLLLIFFLTGDSEQKT